MYDFHWMKTLSRFGETWLNDLRDIHPAVIKAQEDHLPQSKFQDLMEGDFAEAAQAENLTLDRGDQNEVQFISRYDFDDSKTSDNSGVFKELRARNKRQRKALKRQKRVNSDLSLRANIAQENLTNAVRDSEYKDRYIEYLTEELERNERQRVYSQQRSDDYVVLLHQELENQQSELRASKITIDQLQASEKSLESAHGNMAALQAELSACKDDLFRLQPAAEVPDSEILRKFELVSQNIVSWIDAEVLAFEKANPGANIETVFAGGRDRAIMTFQQKYPSAAEHLVRFSIHRRLQDHLFSGHVYLWGLPENVQKLLRKAEQSMGKLEPPRDPSTIISWRSETLKALAATIDCRKLKHQQLQNASERLCNDLSRSFPFLFGGHHHVGRFFQDIILPAADLADTIRCSTSEYRFELPRSPNQQFKPALKAHLKSCRLIDIQTTKQLKSDSMVIADNSGMIGTYAIALEPALCRETGDGEEIYLQSQMFLVKLSHPLGKRNKN